MLWEKLARQGPLPCSRRPPAGRRASCAAIRACARRGRRGVRGRGRGRRLDDLRRAVAHRRVAARRASPRRRRATSPPAARRSSTRSPARSSAPGAGSASPRPSSRRCWPHAERRSPRPRARRLGARPREERPPARTGHPLIAYAIATARQAGVFDRVICSTDERPRRPRSRAGTAPTSRSCARRSTRPSTSPDIEWIADLLERLPERYDLFALVRATNPFRGPDAVPARARAAAGDAGGRLDPRGRARQAAPREDVAARRARRCGRCSTSRTSTSAWHAGQYQALPEVYVQNSALEIAWTRVVTETGTREGRVVAPYLTEGLEGFNIDDEDDWERAEALARLAARPRSRRSTARPFVRLNRFHRSARVRSPTVQNEGDSMENRRRTITVAAAAARRGRRARRHRPRRPCAQRRRRRRRTSRSRRSPGSRSRDTRSPASTATGRAARRSVRVPVAALQRRRRHRLHDTSRARPRRSEIITDGDVGYRLRAPRRATNADGTSAARVLEAERRRRQGRDARSHAAPGDLGHGARGPDAHGRPRRVGQQPDRVRLPVAALQRGRAGCTNIPGETPTARIITAGDVGSRLRVIVTASNAGGSSSAAPAASDVVEAARRGAREHRARRRSAARRRPGRR